MAEASEIKVNIGQNRYVPKLLIQVFITASIIFISLIFVSMIIIIKNFSFFWRTALLSFFTLILITQVPSRILLIRRLIVRRGKTMFPLCKADVINEGNNDVKLVYQNEGNSNYYEILKNEKNKENN